MDFVPFMASQQICVWSKSDTSFGGGGAFLGLCEESPAGPGPIVGIVSYYVSGDRQMSVL